MRFANDCNDRRIHIDNTQSNQELFFRRQSELPRFCCGSSSYMLLVAGNGQAHVELQDDCDDRFDRLNLFE